MLVAGRRSPVDGEIKHPKERVIRLVLLPLGLDDRLDDNFRPLGERTRVMKNDHPVLDAALDKSWMKPRIRPQDNLHISPLIFDLRIAMDKMADVG